MFDFFQISAAPLFGHFFRISTLKLKIMLLICCFKKRIMLSSLKNFFPIVQSIILGCCSCCKKSENFDASNSTASSMTTRYAGFLLEGRGAPSSKQLLPSLKSSKKCKRKNNRLAESQCATLENRVEDNRFACFIII